MKSTGTLLHFAKMHGLANDFMMIDAISQKVNLSPEMIRRLADRYTGVGFDQLLLVESPQSRSLDFHYRIFNADGNEVAQCGNGARCFARFVRLKGLTDLREIRVSTTNGRMVLKVTDDEKVVVNMGEPIFKPADIPFKAEKAEKQYILTTGEHTVKCGVVSMGNPHCVIRVKSVENAPVAILGPKLTIHEQFPEKTNVGFMEIINRKHIRIRVFERGVGETKACGSGACAAVAIGVQLALLDNEVQVDLTGGSLQIQWKGPGHAIFMTGTATHVYDGVIRL